MLVHPLIEIFFNLDNAGVDEKSWKKKIGEHISLENYLRKR